MSVWNVPNLKEMLAVLRDPPRNFDRTEAFQVSRTRQLAQHASASVPYYRKLFDRFGIRPDSIRTIDDIRRLPFTSRPDLQFLPPGDVVAEGIDPSTLFSATTSGSSGRPLTVRRTQAERRLHATNLWKMYRTIGSRFTDRRSSLILPKRGRVRNRWNHRLPLFAVERISMLLPNQEILSCLRHNPPDVLIGEAGVVSWVAGDVSDADRRLIRPRFIVTWGETLTPHMRQQVESAFRAPVYDYYTSVEFLMIGIQCPSTGLYHISDRMTLIEVLNGDQPVNEGERGELVGTALQSWAMPFIRYRTGDIVTLGPTPCPCGRSCRTIAAIQGRVLDRIPIGNGDYVHPYSIIRPVVADNPWIRRYQFQQTSSRRMNLQIVPETQPSPHAIEQIEIAVRQNLGPTFQVEIVLVDEIPPSPTGKYYPYVSPERWKAWSRGQDLN